MAGYGRHLISLSNSKAHRLLAALAGVWLTCGRISDSLTFMTHITIPPFNENCVYAHILSGRIVYIGSGTMTRPFTNTNRNRHWHERIAKAQTDGEKLTIRIISYHSNYYEAREAEMLLIKTLRPELNITHHPIPPLAPGQSKLVTCCETNITYKNASTVAKKLGVTKAAISNHLHNRPGFDKVRSFTFRRGKLPTDVLDVTLR